MQVVNDNKVSIRQTFAIALLLCLIAVTGYTLVSRLLDTKTEKLPVVVDKFLNTYLSPGYLTTETDNVFCEYFDTSYSDYSEIENEFNLVFKSYSFDRVSYTLQLEARNFVIIRYYDGDSNLLTPPIGFWFKLSHDKSKIVNWKIGRLQPFSKFDSEYSEVWEDMYA